MGNDTVPIPRRVVTDSNLSLRARSMYALLAAQTDSAELRTSVSDVAKRTGLGRGTTDRALGELEKAGYLIRSQVHEEGGKYGGTVYILR